MNRTTINYLLLSLVLSILGTAACVDQEPAPSLATQTQAIFHGSRSPQVVSLSLGEQLAIGYLADPYGNQFCSGTLIDRDVVVTAQHCTEGSSPSSIRFGVGKPEQPDGFFEVQAVREHQSRDVALLFLAEDAVSRVPQIEPLPFLRQGLPQSMVGHRVEASGYGQTHDNSTGRFFAALTLIGMDSDYYTVDGRGQQGICFGDSGGPLLVSFGGDTIVAGVESHGDSSCVDVDNLTRLDQVRDWIDQSNGSFDPNQSDPGYEQDTGGKPPVGDQTGTSGDSGGKPPVSGPGTEPPNSGDWPSSDDPQDPESDWPWDGPDFSGCSAAGNGSVDVAWLALVPLMLGLARRKRAGGR